MSEGVGAPAIGYRRADASTERETMRSQVATVGAFCGSVPESVARQRETAHIVVYFATGNGVEFEPSDLRYGVRRAKRVTMARRFIPPHLSKPELDELAAALVALADRPSSA